MIGDTITGNTAATNGFPPGGIYVVSNDTTTVSNLTIRNTTISGNQVDGGYGGGYRRLQESSGTGVDGRVTIDIDRSTISGNEITGAGGAGAGIAASDGNWTVTNSTIRGNKPPGQRVNEGRRLQRSLPTPPVAPPQLDMELRHHRRQLGGTTGQGGNFNCRAAALWTWVRASLPVEWRGRCSGLLSS